jgi:RNA recognition motif-containing protein
MKIIIKNIGWKVTADSLTAVFSRYGKVASSVIFTNDGPTSNRNTGYIYMPDNAEALHAVKQLNGCVVDGQELLVEAVPTEVRTTRLFFYNRIGRIRKIKNTLFH